MRRIALRLLLDTALVAVMLFAAAGTLRWPRGWTLLALMLLVRAIGALAVYRVSPALLRERARLPVHAAQPRTDRVLLASVLATGFLGIPAIAAGDVFHWHVQTVTTPLVAGAGLALFLLGWCLKSLALYANAFAVSVVRPQRERQQTVVDTGVYRTVRHPFYAADPLIFVGMALWLGSYAAAAVSVLPVGLMIARLLLEERFLLRELPGYKEYTERVHYRLVPRIW